MSKKAVNILFTSLLCLLIGYEMLVLIDGSWIASQHLTTRMSTKVINDLAAGVNPYGAAWIENPNALPPTYYESGFFHIFPAVLMTKLGLSVFVSQSVTNIIYVILTMMMSFVCIKMMTGSVNLGLLASSVMYYVVNSRDYALTRPDTLCTCIILLIICIIYKDSKKSEKINEWLIAFLCVLQVFLKIHYGSITAAVVVYFFLKSFKKEEKEKYKIPCWVTLGLKAALITGIMIAYTQICFPTFFSTFIVRVIYMAKSNTENPDFAYLMGKWSEIFIRWWPVVIPMAASLMTGVVNLIRNKQDNNSERQMEIFFIVNTIVNIIALCYMGLWQGNGLGYFNVMLVPQMVIGAIYYLNKWINKYKDSKVVKTISLSVCVTSIVVTIFHNRDIKYTPHGPVPYDYGNEEARNYFDSFGDSELLLSPNYAWYSLSTGRYQWDYGDQIYMPFDIGTSPRWNFLFPYTNRYIARMREYANEMLNKVNNKEYALIITDNYNVLGLNLGLEEAFKKAIDKNYEQDDETGFYLPKN